MSIFKYKIKPCYNQLVGIIIFTIASLYLINRLEPSFLRGINSYNEITMKPITMFGLILSSVILYFITPTTKLYDKISTLIVSISSIWLQLLVFFLCVVNSKLFNLFLNNNNNNNTLTLEYYPSLGTIFCFFLISCGGLIALFNTANFVKRIRKIGILLFIMGGFGIIGNLFDIPILYYQSGFSNGMALISSISIFLCGLGFYICNKQIVKT